MHNCRLTKNRLIDLALDEVAPAEARQLLKELDNCAACQAEYATLNNTWRVSGQALRSALPTEDFWPAYHARLRSRLIEARLINGSSAVQPARLSLGLRLGVGLRKMATTSVRVPVPAALAMMVLVGIVSFSLRSRGQASVTTLTPLAPVETRTVEVPVVQEKVVTQIVYVEQKAHRYKGALDRRKPNALKNVARAEPNASGRTAMSLVGFKPTDKVKLTIIKENYRDEK